MRKLPLLLGVGLLATSVTIGGIGCSSSNNGNASDTPTSVVLETPTVSATTPTTPGGIAAETSTP